MSEFVALVAAVLVAIGIWRLCSCPRCGRLRWPRRRGCLCPRCERELAARYALIFTLACATIASRRLKGGDK
jgi:hypothetical protein